MGNEVTLQQMVDTLAPSLGVEKATSLIKDAFVKAGLPVKDTYDKQEALNMCEVLKTEPEGLIKIIAGTLATKILLG